MQGGIIIFLHYLKTSEFAKVVGVSKHTLFYYDKVGVFCPEYKDEHGFRAYSSLQIESFFVLQSLKEMGVSLNNIKAYLEERSPTKCMNLLKEHESILKEEINKLANTIDLIKAKQNMIQAYFDSKPEQVKVVYEKQESLFVTKSSADEYYVPFAKHLREGSAKNLNLPYAIGHIVINENLDDKEIFDYYFSRTNQEGSDSFIKEAGNYLNYYHSKGYWTIEEAYDVVLAYAKEEGISLDKYFYEDMVLDELAEKDIADYVIKLSIRILY